MNWAYNLWYGYTVPSLYGNGPEALIELIVVGAISAILIPPIRRWFQAEYHKIHDKIDLGHKELHAKLDANREVLHHIVRHSSEIPNLPGMEPVRKPKKASTK